MIATCTDYGLDSHTTENPGVWIGHEPDDRKLASVGVHLRRHVSSHGIGLNISVDLDWFDRIVACGLVGKRATSIEFEQESNARPLEVSEVASTFAIHVANRLGDVDGHVEIMSEIDVLPNTLDLS